MSQRDRLIPVPRPRAAVQLFETQLPLTENGIVIERYTTARGTVFERHVLALGVEHWYRAVKADELP